MKRNKAMQNNVHAMMSEGKTNRPDGTWGFYKNGDEGRKVAARKAQATARNRKNAEKRLAKRSKS